LQLYITLAFRVHFVKFKFAPRDIKPTLQVELYLKLNRCKSKASWTAVRPAPQKEASRWCDTTLPNFRLSPPPCSKLTVL
jgi:hypothetical protein